MNAWMKKWIFPPDFPEDEEKQRLAHLLNFATGFGLIFLGVLIIATQLNGAYPLSVSLINALTFVGVLVMHALLRRGDVRRVGLALIILTFVWITLAVANLGTIRAPAAGGYLYVIILSGLVLDKRAVLVSFLCSSLAIAGLIAAENAGLLPESVYVVSAVQWITYTFMFGVSGFLTYHENQAVRSSLQRARTEIAERQRVELEMSKLSRAVEQSPASIVITDLQGRIEYVNPAFTRVTGYSVEEASGKNPRILKSELSRPETYAELWQALKAGREWRGEFANRKKDGSLYYEAASISPIINASGEVTHYLAVKEDITEQKLVEAALHESETLYRLLAENVSDVIWVLDTFTGYFRYVSPSVERLRGYTVEEVLQQTISEALAPESLAMLADLVPARSADFENGLRISYTDELVQPCKDGSLVWTETSTRFVINESTGHLEVYGVSRDITRRKRIEQMTALRLELLEYSADLNLSEFLRIALDKVAEFSGSQIGFCHFVEDDQTTLSLQGWSNRTLAEFCTAQSRDRHYGLSQAGVWADCIRERGPVIHNDYAALPNRKGLPAGHAQVTRELVVPVFRGEKIVAILGVGNKSSDYDEGDVEELNYMAYMVWEIGKRKQAEQNLSEARSRLELLSQNLPEAGLYIYLQDKHGKASYEYMSAGMQTLTGVNIEDALRDPEVVEAQILPEYRAQIREQEEITRHQLMQFEMEFQQVNATSGETHWMLVRSTPRRREDGSTVWYGMQMDICGQKRNQRLLEDVNDQLRARMVDIEKLQEELRQQTVIDPLTGLFNRRYLADMLPREVARADREQAPLSILVGDLDHFKLVNDTYGHQAGDQFLREVATLLKSCARRSDIICRYGGEEFLLVLPGTSSEAARLRAEEMREKCAAYVFRPNGKEVYVTLSFGVATYPQDSADVEEVISRADQALYRSKDSGRNRVTAWGE